MNKKYIDTKLSADPATLYWNDKKKFEKYVKKIKYSKDIGTVDSEEEEYYGKKDQN